MFVIKKGGNDHVFIFLFFILSFTCSIVVSAEEAVPLKLGAVKIYPSFGINERYDDNIFAQGTPRLSSLITTIDTSLSSTAEKSTYRMGAVYALSKAIYHGSQTDGFVDHFVDLSALFAPTSRLMTSAWGSYYKLHDNRGSTFIGDGISFRSPDKYHQTTVGSNISYGINARIGMDMQYSSKRYDNHQSATAARDVDTTNAGFLFSYPLAAKTSIALDVRYQHFNYTLFSPTMNLDSSEQRYFLGVDWEAKAKTSGSVRVGYLRKNFAKPQTKSSGSLSWEVSVLWTPLSYSSWSLATSAMTQEGDGSTSYIKNNTVSLDWGHQWSKQFSHRAALALSYSVAKGMIPVERKDTLITSTLAVDYQFRRWLTLSAEYDYTNKRSNLPNTAFHQNVLLFTLNGML